MSMCFDPDNAKVLHIEPTAVCNAECPQCDRDNPKLFNKKIKIELTLAKIKTLVSDQFIQGLDKLFFCGNFGEPAACKEVIDIFRYFKQVNPNITLGMNTNGGVRTTGWWRELAGVMNGPLDYVVFSIDGLEDTNHIYRVNVSWRRVMENVKAYISNGGNAHWDMLVFDHNEHQVDQAEQLAKDMGFSWFRSKVSKRFSTMPVKFLNPPKNMPVPETEQTTNIDCFALREKSVYMAVTGELYPCAFFGVRAFSKDTEINHWIDSPNWVAISNSWTDNPHPICVDTCGVTDKPSSFARQWHREVAFNSHNNSK